MWMIKIKSLPLFLHKSSNMFTTDVKQSRKYKTHKGAQKWIDNITCDDGYDEYKFRFSGLEFILTTDGEEVEEKEENKMERDILLLVGLSSSGVKHGET